MVLFSIFVAEITTIHDKKDNYQSIIIRIKSGHHSHHRQMSQIYFLKDGIFEMIQNAMNRYYYTECISTYELVIAESDGYMVSIKCGVTVDALFSLHKSSRKDDSIGYELVKT